MSVRITYGTGGYDPAKPNDNAVEQWDDDTRTHTDYRTSPTTTRPYTAAENAAADARATEATMASNENTIRGQAENALTGNRTFLALGSPTNAQNAAQIKALTRQNNGIIRLLLRKLDGTD